MAIHLPDYIASIQTRSEKIFHDVFVIEAKKPHASSGQQLLNDRCKLALEMKKMLDAMVDARVPSPVVCGLLVEGKEVTSHHGHVIKVYENKTRSRVYQLQDGDGVGGGVCFNKTCRVQPSTWATRPCHHC